MKEKRFDQFTAPCASPIMVCDAKVMPSVTTGRKISSGVFSYGNLIQFPSRQLCVQASSSVALRVNGHKLGPRKVITRAPLVANSRLASIKSACSGSMMTSSSALPPALRMPYSVAAPPVCFSASCSNAASDSAPPRTPHRPENHMVTRTSGRERQTEEGSRQAPCLCGYNNMAAN